MEEKWGADWRVDKPYILPNGKRAKKNSRATWWGTQKPMYAFIERLIALGCSEADALSLAEQVHASVEVSKGGTRPWKKVTKAFVVELKTLSPDFVAE